MSIENNLERIATALEALVASKAGASAKAPKQKAVAAPVEPPPVPASTPVPATTATDAPPAAPSVTEAATTPEAPQAPTAPAGLEVNSPEECNKLLIAEYNRLGATPEVMQRILGVMENNFKVRSVNDLSKEQYGPLITAVREIK